MSKNNIIKITVFLFLAAIISDCGDVAAQHRRNQQVIRAYPLLGATVSQIRGDELRGFDKWGFTAGVGAIATLSERNMLYLSLEGCFSQRGAYNNTGDPYSMRGLTLNYVDIPLTFHFTDPYGGMTIGMGLLYSRLVQQPHGELFYDTNYFLPDTSNMSFLKNDLAFAIDFRFPVWQNLLINIRYQHSIIPIKRDWAFTEYGTQFSGGHTTWSNDLYNSSLTFRLLYVFGEPLSKAKKYAKKKKR